MMLISEPKLRKIDPNSTPTAPAPMMANDFGICLSDRISMLVRMVSSGLSPGSIFASEPVARMTFLAWTLDAPLPSTATVSTPFFAGPVSLPNPGTMVTLFFRIRKSRPLTCFVTIWFLRSRTVCQLI